jgi:hypothetical protein
MDLEAVAFVHKIPRRRLDAGAMPELRSQEHRFWRMPLPSASSGRRRKRDRSRVFPGAVTWHRHQYSRKGESVRNSSARLIARLDLPDQSVVKNSGCAF